MGGVVDIAPGAAAFDAHFPRAGSTRMPLHPREIDHQAIITGSQPGAVMSTAAHSQQQVVFAAKVDRRDHIGGIDTAGNQPGSLVDHAVVKLASFVITGHLRVGLIRRAGCL